MQFLVVYSRAQITAAIAAAVGCQNGAAFRPQITPADAARESRAHPPRDANEKSNETHNIPFREEFVSDSVSSRISPKTNLACRPEGGIRDAIRRAVNPAPLGTYTVA